MLQNNTLRELILDRITFKINHLFERTLFSSDIIDDYGFTYCPQIRKNCRHFRHFQSIEARITHWETEHPDARLGLTDCAWIVGGGLLRWQSFKGKYVKEMPEPIIEGKSKTWSLADIKDLINKVDFSELHTAEQIQWSEIRAKARENAEKWNQEIPTLLNLNPDDCNIQKLHNEFIHEGIILCRQRFPYSDIHEQLKMWINPLVDEFVPENSLNTYEAMWEFIKNKKNKLWLASFWITKPSEMYPRDDFGEHETWECLSKYIQYENDSPSIHELSQSYNNRVLEMLDEFRNLHSNHEIIVTPYTTKEELFFFCDLYKSIFPELKHCMIKVIATVDCTIQELHKLILEESHKNYNFESLPRHISNLRRLTWGLIQEVTTWNKIPIIVIANAENLSTKAIKEIEDLYSRFEVGFFLGVQEQDDINDLFIRETILFKIPASNRLLDFYEQLKALIDQNVSTKNAIQMLRSSRF